MLKQRWFIIFKLLFLYFLPQLIKMVVTLAIYRFYMIFYKNIWIVSERENEARDNGYWFFKYMRENHLEKNVYYAIHKTASDYTKIKNLGNIVEFGGFKHHLLTWCADCFISAHMGNGFPTKRIGLILANLGVYKFKTVFLQHGVIKDIVKAAFRKNYKTDLFCCVATREADFVCDVFEQPKEVVKITGLCRYDNLLNFSIKPTQILLMPTWRGWLSLSPDKDKAKAKAIFKNTSYFKNYMELLRDEKLNEFLSSQNLKIIFFLHHHFQEYLSLFENIGGNIILASEKDYDVQQLLMESVMLITDYSSIAFDFAYMKKPLLYYQFDYEEYSKKHYDKGYFDYKNDGFGSVCVQSKDVIQGIKELYDAGFENSEIYLKRINDFFYYRDRKNCERVYDAILKL